VDYAIQRKNMVESQVRPSDVTDRRVIRGMQALARERFVPEAVKSLAYMDGPVPLSAAAGSKRALLAPRVLAKLVQALEIEAGSVVLDVGAGSGYAAALLAGIAGRVVALESDKALASLARAALEETGAGNVAVVEGDRPRGWAPEGPYDAILMEGAVETVSPELLDQLKDGGRLAAIVRRGGTGRATVWRRNGRGFGSADIFDATADLLPGFETAPAFTF
jgi:protein-L-isoaspartate(D-aspartate) O-methyltransferase